MLADTISISILIVYLFPAYMFILYKHIWWLCFLLAVISANIVVEGVKGLLPYGRPAGAKGCDLFCIGGGVGGEPAFPSGHMTATTMFVGVMWLHYGHTYILVAGIPWILAMGWSRWVKRCHTWQQVVGGIFTGTVFSYIYETITDAKE
jgi:membrane-associated phospholipid phosphatase